jgi:hypothetical protein
MRSMGFPNRKGSPCCYYPWSVVIKGTVYDCYIYIYIFLANYLRVIFVMPLAYGFLRGRPESYIPRRAH